MSSHSSLCVSRDAYTWTRPGRGESYCPRGEKQYLSSKRSLELPCHPLSGDAFSPCIRDIDQLILYLEVCQPPPLEGNLRTQFLAVAGHPFYRPPLKRLSPWNQTEQNREFPITGDFTQPPFRESQILAIFFQHNRTGQPPRKYQADRAFGRSEQRHLVGREQFSDTLPKIICAVPSGCTFLHCPPNPKSVPLLSSALLQAVTFVGLLPALVGREIEQLKAEGLAVFLEHSLYVVVETGVVLRLNFNGNANEGR